MVRLAVQEMVFAVWLIAKGNVVITVAHNSET
jgi:hypothetical protein